MIDRFNIRVYGLVTDHQRILVTDEFRLGIFMTKFPGGGLQFGEGTVDCLRREFMEELNTPIEEIIHYYTTEFFQPTTLLPSNMQLINIYYKVKLPKPYRFETTMKRFDIPPADEAQSFRWVTIGELIPEEFTFPIDQFLVRKIKQEGI
jgi:8-oxo-dGTP pyrophosphatase MutT (NUDIX family)